MVETPEDSSDTVIPNSVDETGDSAIRDELTSNVSSWRDDIEDVQLRTFAERFPAPADAVRLAFDHRQKLSNAIPIPGKKATSEDWEAFRSSLAKANGVPDGPDGYEIVIPDHASAAITNDPDLAQRLTEFSKAMHAHQATPEIVQGAIDFYFQMMADAQKNIQLQHELARQEAQSELSSEWGRHFDRFTELARRVATDSELVGSRFGSWLERAEVDGVKLGNHPEFVRAFASIGRRVVEDVVQNSSGTTNPIAISERISEIHAMEFGDSENRLKFKSQPVQAELQELYRQLHGDEPHIGGPR